MSENRRLLPLAGLALAAAALVAACTGHDGTPVGFDGRGEPDALLPLAELRCTVEVARGGVWCEPVRAGTGGISAAEVYMGSPYVAFLSSNIGITDTTFAFDTRIVNQIAQKLGTSDGVNLHPEGTRAFFTSGPTVTAKQNNSLPASVSVKNPDGVTDFRTSQPGYTGWSNRPYFQYGAVLNPGDTAAAKRWILQVSNVASFSFTVAVAARVQFPSGWVDVFPTDTVLEPGDTIVVMGRRRDHTGALAGTGALSWTSSDPTKVAVVAALSDTTARVTAVAAGNATLIASGPNAEYTYQPNRVGTAAVTVTP